MDCEEEKVRGISHASLLVVMGGMMTVRPGINRGCRRGPEVLLFVSVYVVVRVF